LGPQPGQRPAARGHLIVGQVAASLQDPADPVEGTRQRSLAVAYLLAQRLGLPLEPGPPLRPPRVILPLRTGVARVPTHLPAQLLEFLLAPAVALARLARPSPPAGAGWHHHLAQCRREVAPLLR